MLKVIGNPMTRAGRVLWTLEELGLDYEIVPASPHSDAIRAVNPLGKAPSLVTDEGAINDSYAIMQYLADREGKLTHPAGSYARARQDSIAFFTLDQIEGPLWMAAKHSFVWPEAMRVEAVKAPCREEAARGFVALGKLLGDGPYATGEMFTIADILIGHCANWARAAKVALPEEGEVAEYLARLAARPALAASMAKGKAAVAAASC